MVNQHCIWFCCKVAEPKRRGTRVHALFRVTEFWKNWSHVVGTSDIFRWNLSTKNVDVYYSWYTLMASEANTVNVPHSHDNSTKPCKQQCCTKMTEHDIHGDSGSVNCELRTHTNLALLGIPALLLNHMPVANAQSALASQITWHECALTVWCVLP
jgi:hypothetical protein